MRKTPNQTFLSYVDESYDNINITTQNAHGHKKQIKINTTPNTKPLPKNKATTAVTLGIITLVIGLVGFITFPATTPIVALLIATGAAWALISIGQKTPPEALKRKKIWTTITIALFSITIALLPLGATAFFKGLLTDNYTPMAERLEGFSLDARTGLHYRTATIYPCQADNECEINIQLADPAHTGTCPNGGIISMDIVLQINGNDRTSIEIPFTGITPEPKKFSTNHTGYKKDHMFIVASSPNIRCS